MKTAIITGASSGIGAETARLLSANYFNIVVVYQHNEQGAQEVAQEIEKNGVESLVIQADLGKEADAQKVVEETIKKFGQIDVLVNNAGGYIDGDEWNGSSEVWAQTFEKNLLSAMNTSKFAIQQFQKQQSGVIVNIASRHGLSGQHDATAYAAAKAGIINITQAYAKLLAPYGRANSIAPGAVMTGYWLTAPQDEIDESLKDTPLKKMAETRDVAEAVLFLATDRSQMITGQNLVVDGGYLLK